MLTQLVHDYLLLGVAMFIIEYAGGGRRRSFGRNIAFLILMLATWPIPFAVFLQRQRRDAK